jgi:hypothetical protein
MCRGCRKDWRILSLSSFTPANSFFFGLMLSKLSLIDPAEFLENPQFCVPTQEYGFTPENQVELSLE